MRPYNSRKLNFRSTCCVFLGYSAQYKGYKCLEPHTGRVYLSRDVVFDESIFPFKELHPNAGALLQKELFLLPDSSLFTGDVNCTSPNATNPSLESESEQTDQAPDSTLAGSLGAPALGVVTPDPGATENPTAATQDDPPAGSGARSNLDSPAPIATELGASSGSPRGGDTHLSTTAPAAPPAPASSGPSARRGTEQPASPTAAPASPASPASSDSRTRHPPVLRRHLALTRTRSRQYQQRSRPLDPLHQHRDLVRWLHVPKQDYKVESSSPNGFTTALSGMEISVAQVNLKVYRKLLMIQDGEMPWKMSMLP